MVDFSRRDLLGAAALAAGTGAGLGLASPVQAQQKHIIKIVNTQGNATVTLQELMKRQGYLQEMGVEPQITYV